RDGGVPRLKQKPVSLGDDPRRHAAPRRPLPPGWPNDAPSPANFHKVELSRGSDPLANVVELFAVSTAGRPEKISACAEFRGGDSHAFLIFAAGGNLTHRSPRQSRNATCPTSHTRAGDRRSATASW